MTQSQLPTEPFYSVSSISAWAGRNNGILWFGDKQDNMPYLENQGMYYYFGIDADKKYNLICTSTHDLGAMK